MMPCDSVYIFQKTNKLMMMMSESERVREMRIFAYVLCGVLHIREIFKLKCSQSVSDVECDYT